MSLFPDEQDPEQILEPHLVYGALRDAGILDEGPWNSLPASVYQPIEKFARELLWVVEEAFADEGVDTLNGDDCVIVVADRAQARSVAWRAKRGANEVVFLDPEALYEPFQELFGGPLKVGQSLSRWERFADSIGELVTEHIAAVQKTLVRQVEATDLVDYDPDFHDLPIARFLSEDAGPSRKTARVPRHLFAAKPQAPAPPPRPKVKAPPRQKSHKPQPGEEYLTDVSGNMVKVRIYRDTGKGQARYIVTRVDNGQALHKPRTARALHPVTGIG